jgi:hypothetical protein
VAIRAGLGAQAQTGGPGQAGPAGPPRHGWVSEGRSYAKWGPAAAQQGRQAVNWHARHATWSPILCVRGPTRLLSVLFPACWFRVPHLVVLHIAIFVFDIIG